MQYLLSLQRLQLVRKTLSRGIAKLGLHERSSSIGKSGVHGVAPQPNLPASPTKRDPTAHLFDQTVMLQFSTFIARTNIQARYAYKSSWIMNAQYLIDPWFSSAVYPCFEALHMKLRPADMRRSFLPPYALRCRHKPPGLRWGQVQA